MKTDLAIFLNTLLSWKSLTFGHVAIVVAYYITFETKLEYLWPRYCIVGINLDFTQILTNSFIYFLQDALFTAFNPKFAGKSI